MDVCVENVFITPAIEEINVIQATAEENDRAASSDRIMGIERRTRNKNCSAASARGFVESVGRAAVVVAGL